MRLRIRTRLTLLFFALMLAILTTAGVLIYQAFASQLDLAINERLAATAKEIATDLEDGETKVLRDFGEGETEGLFAQVVSKTGSVVEQHDSIEQPLVRPADLQDVSRNGFIEQSVRDPARTVVEPARLAVAIAANEFVVVGKPLQERNDTLFHLFMLLWVAGPVLCLAVTGLAWILAGAALRPVESLRREASQISETNLAMRLPGPNTGDEIETLAATLNDLLARLEQAFERERRFVDDASHELRTPLGILKAELDLALRRSRTKEELERAIVSASEESERLNRIADDLLFLARSDRGKLEIHKEKVDVTKILERAGARFKMKARNAGVKLVIDSPASYFVELDSVRIEQAVGNLLANAFDHVRRGGCVRAAAQCEDSAAISISVADDGPGFPEPFLASAFDPFARADTGRSRSIGGTGLGLAIVKGVAEAHGGSVTAVNRPSGGAIVSIRLPL